MWDSVNSMNVPLPSLPVRRIVETVLIAGAECMVMSFATPVMNTSAEDPWTRQTAIQASRMRCGPRTTKSGMSEGSYGSGRRASTAEKAAMAVSFATPVMLSSPA